MLRTAQPSHPHLSPSGVSALNEQPRETLRVRAADGWMLDVAVLPERGPLRGLALLGHAMMVDRRSMDRPSGRGLASTLAESGWRVYLLDVRGHGASVPPAGCRWSWSYDDIVRFDLPACVDAARRDRPGYPVFLVGHSLCGHCSIAATGTGAYAAPPDAQVLLSANIWLPSLEPSRSRRFRKSSVIRTARTITRMTGHFPSQRLGVGPADEARPYIEDLTRYWVEDSWSSTSGVDYLEAAKQITEPVLSVLGGGDELLGHFEAATRWAQRIGPHGAEVWLVGQGDPGLDFDPDHMSLVADLRSISVWNRVLKWMDDALR